MKGNQLQEVSSFEIPGDKINSATLHTASETLAVWHHHHQEVFPNATSDVAEGDTSIEKHGSRTLPGKCSAIES